MLLAGLCVLSYLPALTQPFIEDDYHLIGLAESIGPADQVGALLCAPAFAVRATAVWLMHSLHVAFGMNPLPFYAASVLLHIGVTWMVYGLGAWECIGYEVSLWAAAFFAVYEGHQEAVMWISASNELLMCFFGMLSFASLRRFLSGSRGRAGWYALSLVSYGLALISKESAVVWCLLFPVILILNRNRHRGCWLIPFAVLSASCAIWILAGKGDSFRFLDHSFSISAPFWMTLPRSMVRLLWFWGLAAMAAVWVWGDSRLRRVAAHGLVWAAIAFLPYSFLTYMPFVPSRHTYPASIGLALICGAGAVSLARFSRGSRFAAVAAIIMVLHNVGYLWLVKRPQFLERAAPTEHLLVYARTHPGPVYVRCFPRARPIAEEALRLMTNRPARGFLLFYGG